MINGSLFLPSGANNRRLATQLQTYRVSLIHFYRCWNTYLFTHDNTKYWANNKILAYKKQFIRTRNLTNGKWKYDSMWKGWSFVSRTNKQNQYNYRLMRVQVVKRTHWCIQLPKQTHFVEIRVVQSNLKVSYFAPI